MKFYFLVFILSVLFLRSFAQPAKPSLLYQFIENKLQQHIVFDEVALFSKKGSDNQYGTGIVSRYAVLSPDKVMLNKIFSGKKSGIKLSLNGEGSQVFTLLLAEEKINSSHDFFVSSIDQDGRKKTALDPGLHYRGYIQGDSASLACISIFSNGDVMGVFAGREGNFVLGKMKDKTDDYVLYNSDKMLLPPGYDCAADNLPQNNQYEQAITTVTPVTTDVPTTLCRKVRFYWEADYNLYSYNFASNLANTQNYLTGLFNIVATLFQNEGIITELSQTAIWTSTDPYATTGSSAALSSFKALWNGAGDTFNGDLAHLIAGGTTNYGGIAYVLSSECNRFNAYAYSNVRGTYQAFPSYTWDVSVVTHETGHNFGSKHTHWCGWNTSEGATCGAIDNCATVQAEGACTTCPATVEIAAPPAGFKGTIMSYCHLRSGIGISFANGFGPLPQAKIRSNISAATCLTTSNGWTGAVNTAWENSGNWSCGSIPTATTDVLIKAGVTNYPVISSPATCRSIKQAAGTTLKVNPAFTLMIAGPPSPQ